MSENSNKIASIFLPHLVTEKQRLENSEDIVFAHYTSAETAYKIFNNQTVWMRNARLMNDYREISHGVDAIKEFFGINNSRGRSFWESLKQIHSEIFNYANEDFTNINFDLENNTYLASFSEHSLKSDPIGRLSMWRAYGGKEGVALLLNKSTLLSDNLKLDAWVYPVNYWDEDVVGNNFYTIMDNIESEIDFLKTIHIDKLRFFIHQMLISFAISLKHPAFKEEKEWRVIHRPSDNLLNNQTDVQDIKPSVQILGGTPQRIYKIPMHEEFGTSIPEVLNKILIGPSKNPFQVSQTISDILKKRGISDPATLIKYSKIPLRI